MYVYSMWYCVMWTWWKANVKVMNVYRRYINIWNCVLKNDTTRTIFFFHFFKILSFFYILILKFYTKTGEFFISNSILHNIQHYLTYKMLFMSPLPPMKTVFHYRLRTETMKLIILLIEFELLFVYVLVSNLKDFYRFSLCKLKELLSFCE